MEPADFKFATSSFTPSVVKFFDSVTGTLTYVVIDVSSKIAIVVDPVLDFDVPASKISTINADKVVEFVKVNGLSVKYILETHAHADHLTAAQYVKSKVGGQVAIGQGITKVQKHFAPVFNLEIPIDGSQFDHLWEDGEEFSLGGIKGKVIHTPGHTNDSNTFVIGDAAFVGDTIFAPDVGTARCDFPGGNAELLYDSIQKIFQLPESTRLFLCHDYPPSNTRPVIAVTSISDHLERNIHLKNGASKTEFVAMRTGRDSKLSPPRLILPSIQLNINAGKFISPEGNGVIYFKLPITSPKI
ncbi:hypothetical protein HK096_003641 [Nowakowskiella sp. JEL0078]|nr:hypothetical protein HK096_003641 [Nowakowskiella sp. JEL0078]